MHLQCFPPTLRECALFRKLVLLDHLLAEYATLETGAGSYIDIIDYSYTTADINRMGLRDKGCGVL